ncbi:Major facilitator superfamily [Neofusicoccum parvum]|uniref:Major facilitator superfamily n=1 Tax=Neofusicoccum parvum TaxID=310453 RepID=A0ACB5SGS0_9PEZI|nr:Major facilitator superfamily [Neofusicoccum parvum]
MALSAKYQSFLSAPATGALAPGASINYVPTATTVAEPTAILKHLAAQGKLLKTKAQKLLSAIEGSDGLCLDVETTLEFVNGGGAYLPGLDDNFVSDRTVTFPTVHIVQFDSQQKIASIRIYWDQASLLRQIEVIGSRARNWPIRDASDQIRIIKACASAAPAVSTASSRRNTSAGNSEDGSRPQTSRSNTSATGDPHASLSLFQPREEDDRPETPSEYSVERARSAKPVSRGLAEIISPEHQAPQRSSSPAKAGAGKKFQPIRLFDTEEEHEQGGQRERGIKTNSKKYDHFVFGEGEDAAEHDTRPTSRSKKHTSQWGFEDFATPEVTKTKVLPQHTKQFGWSDDEEAEDSPVKRPVVHQPRKDAKTHFDFDDEATPVANRTKNVSSKGTKHNDGLGLYQDPVHDDEKSGENGPLSNITKNVNNEKRSKHFNSSFDITDSSPNPSHTSKPGDENGSALSERETKQRGINIAGNGMGASKGHEQATVKQRGINIGGDGMGGKKGTNRDWIFGGPEEEDENPTTTITGKKMNGPASKRDKNAPSEKSFWDF